MFEVKEEITKYRTQILSQARKLRHRGPDWSGIYMSEDCIMAHERLAIVDPASGRQPLYSSDGQIVLAVNGEIYNHQELRKNHCQAYDFQTESDCEVIIALYKLYGSDCISLLNGMFAFALYDAENGTYLIARDHMGIIPLYHGHDAQGHYFIASELKALEGICSSYEPFLPGHYAQGPDPILHKWYDPSWQSYDRLCSNGIGARDIQLALKSAVKRQLMSDVPFALLLSGGLDSSLVTAMARLFAERRIESGNSESAWFPKLHSFAIGLKGSPDLAAAKKAADHIGTVHHEIHFTVQEGFDALRDVIYHLETYDITTIRASTPMYLLARVIKSMGFKMVLSGEGSDEIFGGYLYFHKAPDAESFHEECVRKLESLHLYDCLRANKSLAAWGVEGRVPFLDKEFMEVAMHLSPKQKMCGSGKIEKHVLRQAGEGLLPEEILWRQKEQFSDGVGYDWINQLKALVNKAISDEQFALASERFPIHPPLTKEEYYYRSIFEEHFPSDSAAKAVPSLPSIACSSPIALEWDEAFRAQNEPSGRAIGVHSASL